MTTRKVCNSLLAVFFFSASIWTATHSTPTGGALLFFAVWAFIAFIGCLICALWD